MRLLTVSALSLAALAGAAPASGAAFEEPRTLSDWGPGGEVLVAAPGAVAWTHPTGVRVARPGDSPVRIAGGGLVQDIDVATGPVAAWVDSDMRLHAFAGRDHVVEGTMERVRKASATPSAVAWIGVGAGDERKLQLAVRRPGGGFSAARTPAQDGRPAFGLDAAGSGGRSLLVWPAQDGGARRIQLLAIDAAGDASEPRWLTTPGHDATSADVAMGPGGAGVVAWVDGMPFGPVTAAAVGADGAIGEPQPLDAEPGGAPEVAAGPGGAAVVVWPAGGRVKAALRGPGAAEFSAPVTLPGENVVGWTAAVTERGETVVAWLHAPAGADPRDGARLSAAVAPARGSLGAPETLATHVMRVAGAGNELTWVEGRPDGAYVLERRVRGARLRAGTAGGSGGGTAGPGAADRRAPRVKLRVLGSRGRRVRIAVRSDERATLRASLRRRGRTVGRARATLRPGRTSVVRIKRPAGARRLALTVRATDAAGNVRTVQRAVRLRRR